MVELVNDKAKILAELFPELHASYENWQSWDKKSINPEYSNVRAVRYGEYVTRAKNDYYEACNRFVKKLL